MILYCTGMDVRDCPREIAMIDREGYIYCASCGLRRRAAGVACRVLTRAERETLVSGQPVSWRRKIR